MPQNKTMKRTASAPTFFSLGGPDKDRSGANMSPEWIAAMIGAVAGAAATEIGHLIASAVKRYRLRPLAQADLLIAMKDQAEVHPVWRPLRPLAGLGGRHLTALDGAE